MFTEREYQAWGISGSVSSHHRQSLRKGNGKSNCLKNCWCYPEVWMAQECNIQRKSEWKRDGPGCRLEEDIHRGCPCLLPKLTTEFPLTVSWLLRYLWWCSCFLRPAVDNTVWLVPVHYLDYQNHEVSQTAFLHGFPREPYFLPFSSIWWRPGHAGPLVCCLDLKSSYVIDEEILNHAELLVASCHEQGLPSLSQSKCVMVIPNLSVAHWKLELEAWLLTSSLLASIANALSFR